MVEERQQKGEEVADSSLLQMTKRAVMRVVRELACVSCVSSFFSSRLVTHEQGRDMSNETVAFLEGKKPEAAAGGGGGGSAEGEDEVESGLPADQLFGSTGVKEVEGPPLSDEELDEAIAELVTKLKESKDFKTVASDVAALRATPERREKFVVEVLDSGKSWDELERSSVMKLLSRLVDAGAMARENVSMDECVCDFLCVYLYPSSSLLSFFLFLFIPSVLSF